MRTHYRTFFVVVIFGLSFLAPCSLNISSTFLCTQSDRLQRLNAVVTEEALRANARYAGRVEAVLAEGVNPKDGTQVGTLPLKHYFP